MTKRTTNWMPALRHRRSQNVVLMRISFSKLGRLAQRLERRTQFGRKELRLLPCGEMSALVDLVKVGQVGIGTPGPCLGRSIDVLGEYRDGHRKRYLGGLLRGCNDNAASAAVLPVQPCRRGGG